MKRLFVALMLFAFATPAMAVDTQATAYARLGKVMSNHGFTGLELQLVLADLYGAPRLYDTAAHLTADSGQADGTFGYAANTHALYIFSNSSWSQLFPAASFSSAVTAPSLSITSNTGIDRSTAAALNLGGTNATAVVVTPVLQLAGGVDTSTAAGLAIGGANATSVTITPNTTESGTFSVTGLTTATGGLVTPANIDTATGSVLTTATSGGLFVANASTDAVTTWTLPAAATKASYCFSQGASSLGSNREVDVATPAGSDLIIGTTNAAGASGIATTAGASHGIKNTHATAVRGNMVCLHADGVNTWYMNAISGTWAAF